MRRMKGLCHSDKALTTMVVAAAAALIVTSVGIGTYFLLSNNSQNSSADDLSEPLIEKGAWGLGTKFTYDVVNRNETYGTPKADVTVVAESRGYYILQAFYDASEGNVFTFAMHKTNGSIRFATDEGADSYVYGGNEISLTKWKFLSITASATICVDQEKCIPYKMEIVPISKLFTAVFDHEDETYRLELKAIDGKDAANYVASELDGEKIGLNVSVKIAGYDTSADINGNVSMVYAGRYSYNGESGSAYVIKGDLEADGNLLSASASGKAYFTEYIFFTGEESQYSISLAALILKHTDIDDLLKDIATKSYETIDTFEGRKECTVYTLNDGMENEPVLPFKAESLTAKIYLGEDNIPYRAEAGLSVSGFSLSVVMDVTSCVVNKNLTIQI